jgi:hypothetical protein
VLAISRNRLCFQMVAADSLPCFYSRPALICGHRRSFAVASLCKQRVSGRVSRSVLAGRIARRPARSRCPENFRPGLHGSPRGEQARQFLDGAGQVVQPPVRVARRQGRRRVPGQLLKRAQVDAGPAAQGQVGVPQGVEVGVQRAVRPIHGIGDPGGFQVDPEHVGGHAQRRPSPRLDRLAGRPALQVLPQ